MSTVVTRDERRVTTSARVALFLWSLFLLTGFTVAASIEPDTRGYGTHQRLGLPPCSFQMIFGVPCPTCGTTTCFAHFVRGEWLSAVRANVAGFLLAVVCTIQIPWCWLVAWRGRLVFIRSTSNWLVGIIGIIVVISITQWTLRYFVL